MTGFAAVGCGDVAGVLAGGAGSVVAAGAIIGEGAVINIHLQPVGGHVTTVAGTCRYNVVGRFPRCRAPVVTTRAGAGGGRVIHTDGTPAGGAVTGFAAIG